MRAKRERGRVERESDVAGSAFSDHCAWQTPFFPPSAGAAVAFGKHAVLLRASPDAQPCRKRPRTMVHAHDRWKQHIRQALDLLLPPTESEGETFCRRHVVLEVCHVLRDCWQFHGRPQDIFEPVHSLSQVAQHLLTTYGGYCLTEDGQYLFLQAEERMPYVGFLLVVLQQLLAEYDESRGKLQTAAMWPHYLTRFAGDNGVRLVILRHGGFDRPHGHVNAAEREADAGGPPCGGTGRVSLQALLHEVVGTSNELSVALLANFRLNEEDAVPLAKSLCAECFSAGSQVGGDCGVMSLVSGTDAGTAWAAGGRCPDTTPRQAVSCGRFSTRSVSAHALLLGPMGPLLIHLQQHCHLYPQRGGSDEAEEVRLWEWLQRFVCVPQPTVIVQWGGNDTSTAADPLSRLTSLSDVGGGDGCSLRRYHSFLPEAGNNYNHVCGSELCGNSPVLYVRDATLALECATSSPVGAGVCQVWCVRMSPYS
ncbi:hypothetical protein TraAM80_06636 [Trypanosoma rangeli]|uniref:Uncharacterized protein n=1 Tax=Trypanosoma rangeli TaxID=5698 RepID=A0A422N997_TRYRA|nr:uncharacterized protein TraAM80_06636 [Trypanosoma rangeli]RNF02021.1 hypothetical protein TraAM80_06636 [Trypanosoma rangeli]|eukprot:RNF02021.1 hypothetical protein TraAM80_06636 [Trypanosoma rangeli]